MKKRCEHQWMPLGRDVYSCSKCGVIKENYTAALKQQLTEKDNELEELKNKLDASIAFEMTYYNDLQKAKQQLAEKDKEIEKLKHSVSFTLDDNKLKRIYKKVFNESVEYDLKQIRHQVCEDIDSETISLCKKEPNTLTYKEALYKVFRKYLEQIEGESK